jgi:hypothetical protein
MEQDSGFGWLFNSAELTLIKFLLNLFGLRDGCIIQMERIMSCARNSPGRIENLVCHRNNVVAEVVGRHFDPGWEDV